MKAGPYPRIVFCTLIFFVHTWIVPTGHGSKVQDLTDTPHHVQGEHNSQYDHEAFLGKEQAQQFEHLNMSERLSRLGDIVNKIDKNSDGSISDQELAAWIKYVHRRSILEEAKIRWEYYEKSTDDLLPWEEYKERTYGNMADDHTPGDDGRLSIKVLKDREQRKFKQADKDLDGSLSFDEFVSFYRPEDDPHMRTVVILETIEDMDTDGDGQIGTEEYIANLKKGHDVEEEEPDWLTYEVDNFKRIRDVDKNGALSYDEVEKWLYPEEFDLPLIESLHLIEEADINKDGLLSREEIIENQDIFIGGQATAYGQALVLTHDEF